MSKRKQRDSDHEQKTLPMLIPMNRRMALKVMAVAAATPGLTSCATEAEDGADGSLTIGTAGPTGTAWDPDLLSPVIPWERILTQDELETLASLCDVIIPADERSPSASQLGTHDYIDEWVSAPYSRMGRDRVLIREGLVWLDEETGRRFGQGTRFRDLSPERKDGICSDIAYLPDAAPEFQTGARFFTRVRDLTAGAFWTTEEGMQDLPYIGNVPLERWDPPPREVLEYLGLA
ncbi:MAG: gluconate 2-dehydrogenase subunit 3 family protein [Gemmatimonadetes bacterium]|nr:gluconate 2-dehydrogenase subunit 3 family protein [Gemmatimonadota bacterium]